MSIAARTRLLRLGALGALGVATGAGVLAVALTGAPSAAGAPTCTITWTGATSTDWDTATNWSPARVPTTTDVACMAASPTRSTVVSSQTRTVRAVYFTLAGSRLTVAGGGFTVTEPAGPTGSSVVGLTFSAGTLSGAWNATDLTWTSGSLTGPGTLTSTGTSTACNPNLDTNSRWTNTGTLSWNTTCGYIGFFNGGRFTNAATGTWTITGDGSNGLIDFGSNNGTTNAVVNAGTTTVTLTAATNTVASSVPFADTGTVTVTAGTLSLTGGGVADTPDTGTWNRTLTGTTVTGTAAWAGGSRTATTVSGSGLTVAGGTSTVGTGTLTGLTLTAGSLTVADTKTLTVANLTWTSGSLTGPGTLTSTGTSTACNPNLDTNSRWTNTGTLSWNTTCGYIGFFNGGRFTNAATGTWTITGDGSNGLIDFGSNNGTTNAVVNAGTTTVTLTTASQTLNVAPTFTNTGSLTVTRGTTTLPIVTNLVAGTITGGTWNAPTGTITLPGTVSTNAATVAIGATGQVLASSTGTAAFIPLAANSGSFTSGRSLTLTSSGLANSGTLAVAGGALVVATLTQSAGTTSVATGATLNAGTAAVRINGGLLTGAGTVRGAVSGAGTVAPGTNGVGTLTVTGTVNTTAGTTIAVNETTTAGTTVAGSGAVTVTGAAVAVTTSGAPAIGTVRTVVSGSSRTGTVASVSGVDVPASGGYWVVGYTPTSVTLTLTAYPAVSVAGGAVVVEGNSGMTPATFTVTLAGPSPAQAVVDYATVAGTATSGVDYAGQTGTLTFLPGETSKTVQVSVVGDTLHENDETFGLVLSNPRNTSLGTATAGATIDDDDAVPAFSVDDAQGATSAAGGGTVTFTVSLNTPSGLDATVHYATVDGTAVAGTDYVATNGTVTIPAGATSATVDVQLTTVTTYAAPKTFSLVLTAPVEATVVDGSGTGTIVNGNPNGPTVAAVVPGSGAQGTAVAVTVDGTGFTAGSTVAVSGTGVVVSAVTVVDPTRITATFTVAASATVSARSVTVTAAGLSDTCNGCFAVVPRPTVTGVDRPNLAVGTTDVLVTITGSQFQPGADVVLVKGSKKVAAGSTTTNSATSVTAFVTLARTTPVGTWNVQVVNPDGGTGTCTGCVTVWAAPTVTGVSPSSLARGTTTNVTITGTGFVAGAAVSVPGAQLSNVTVVNATTITATVRVPVNATTGIRTVKVVNPVSAGSGTGAAAAALTVT